MFLEIDFVETKIKPKEQSLQATEDQVLSTLRQINKVSKLRKVFENSKRRIKSPRKGYTSPVENCDNEFVFIKDKSTKIVGHVPQRDRTFLSPLEVKGSLHINESVDTDKWQRCTSNGENSEPVYIDLVKNHQIDQNSYEGINFAKVEKLKNDGKLKRRKMRTFTSGSLRLLDNKGLEYQGEIPLDRFVVQPKIIEKDKK